MRELNYSLVDVFTTRQFAGNPLAVYTDAAGLTSEEMQAIAREMNLSETTFVERRDVAIERKEGVRVRIFTTAEELPFAGHPTLGTTAVLARIAPEIVVDGRITLDLKAGKIPVQLSPAPSSSEGGGVDAVYGQMQQLDPTFGEQHSPAEIAALLGLAEGDLLPGIPIQTVSTGTAFVIVVLRSVEALGRMSVDLSALKAYRSQHDCRFLYAFAPTGDKANPWRARMQFYGGEDPATGSAAGCAISFLVAHSLVQSGETILLQQGVEMGRPSNLYLSAERIEGKVTGVRVGGCTVVVANGRLFLQ